MTRRDALERLALLLGGALSAATTSGFLAGCRVSRDARYSPRTLSAEQDELAAAIAETIIPETDTPGARSALVNRFVDLMLTDWFPAAERDRFLTGLSDIDEECVARYGATFVRCVENQQQAILIERDDAAFRARQMGVDPLPFFAIMKELTLIGYYTSEIGGAEELQWLAVPTRFDGCIPLAEVGRTWA